jgi:hypothetical protein
LTLNRKAFHLCHLLGNFSEAHTAPAKDSTGGKRKDAPTPEIPLKPDAPAMPPNKALARDMARSGITRVPVDYYHYGAFRYTSLKYAVAEAKRASQR